MVPIFAAPTNPLWSRVMGYSPFSLCVIHNEGLCPSSGDINKLMMMMSYTIIIHTYTYMLLTVYPRSGSKGISDSPTIMNCTQTYLICSRNIDVRKDN
jgi:exo-beta-1,3-glucanase (GH17 family)